ncbi:hypothetical protein Q8F55_007180 [Vanrija albida]|uniref:Uncharacterized protein n=1 Tax=Vanrija albida TaxID=181172 RepID=A0ABR3PZN9_9TREE
MPSPKVAIAIASSPSAADGHQPGDTLRPFTAFRWAGLDVDFISPSGSYPAIEPASPTTASFEERALLADPGSELRAALARVRAPSDPGAYSIVLAPPGSVFAAAVAEAGGIAVTVPLPSATSPRTSLDVARDGPDQAGAADVRAELAGLSDGSLGAVSVNGRAVSARSARAAEAAALAAIDVYNKL